MATIDDLTSATTSLLDAVTDGKAALDLAVDQTSNNVASVNNMHADVAGWVNDAFGYKTSASAFATSASNSVVTATARANESSQNATLSQTYRNQAQGYSLTSVNAKERALTAADAAELYAYEASISVATLVGLPSTNASSNTVMEISAGTHTLGIQAGKNLIPGMSIVIAAGSTPTANWVHGIIESYDTVTGELIFVVDLVNGIGTFDDWIISLSAPIGTNSVVLTGIPTAPTAEEGSNTIQIANTAYVAENAVLKTGYDGSAIIPAGTTLQRDLVPSAGHMRFNLDEVSFEGFNGTGWVPVGSGGSGGGMSWIESAIDVTTQAGIGILLNTASGNRIVTFHANPEIGDTVAIADLKNTFGVHPCTVVTTGLVVHGEVMASDLLLNTPSQRVIFTYASVADGWIVTNLTTFSRARTDSGLHLISTMASNALIGAVVLNASAGATENYLHILAASATLTLPLGPTIGATLSVVNFSSVNTCVIDRNGSRINGLEENLTIDILGITVKLFYSGAAYGWVTI